MARNFWTEEELILALDVYFKLPFGRLNSTTPEVIELAGFLNGRTPNSASMRLNNFAACDPSIAGTMGPNGHIRTGLVGGKDICQPIWDKYANNKGLLFETATKIKAAKLNKPISEILTNTDLEELSSLRGVTKERMVKTRIHQDAFRSMILGIYDKKCAITGIDIPGLLVASHIIPWKDNKDTRLDPENGICLSPLYDKAFDRGLISIDTNYNIILSEKLNKKCSKEYYIKYFQSIDNVKLNLPFDHKPNQLYLEYHRDKIFNKK